MIIVETERSTYLDVSKADWQAPKHRHVGIEQSYVLEGTLVDDDGACAAGNFVWRRAGSVHSAWSPEGCRRVPRVGEASERRR